MAFNSPVSLLMGSCFPLMKCGCSWSSFGIHTIVLWWQNPAFFRNSVCGEAPRADGKILKEVVNSIKVSNKSNWGIWRPWENTMEELTHASCCLFPRCSNPPRFLWVGIPVGWNFTFLPNSCLLSSIPNIDSNLNQAWSGWSEGCPPRPQEYVNQPGFIHPGLTFEMCIPRKNLIDSQRNPVSLLIAKSDCVQPTNFGAF